MAAAREIRVEIAGDSSALVRELQQLRRQLSTTKEPTTMKQLVSRLRGLFNRGRVLHYVDIFAASFGMALWYDRAHLLDAHGLNAVGCAIFGACVVGAKALLEVFRKSTPATSPVSPLLDAAAAEFEKVQPADLVTAEIAAGHAAAWDGKGAKPTT